MPQDAEIQAKKVLNDKNPGFYQFQDLMKKYPPNPPKIEFNPKEDLVTLPLYRENDGIAKRCHDNPL